MILFKKGGRAQRGQSLPGNLGARVSFPPDDDHEKWGATVTINYRVMLALAGLFMALLAIATAVQGYFEHSWVVVIFQFVASALLFFGVFVAMLYVATERVSWIAIGLLLFGVAVAFALSAFAHFQKRVDLWLEPFSQENLERSNQLANGLWGMASGGLTGTGLGAGRPWLTSFAESDFIFSSLAEELGLFGSVAILLLYLVFVQRGIRTALGVRDGFGKLLAIGLTFSVAFQLFIVIGGVTRVIPLTGLTTPFLSLGGSSLLANWIIMSLLLRISDQARRPVPALPVGVDADPVAAEATQVVQL